MEPSTVANAIQDELAGAAGPPRADRAADRDAFIPKDHYISPEFLRLENERLWPRVWQMACREEELQGVGAYVTYNIMNESIVLTRTADDQIKAYYNVCQHRGRRLTQGCGHISGFHCRFHGWQWNLDGSVRRIVERQDWDGSPNFTDDDLRLQEVRVDTWAGWVFINMDPDAEPLQDFLGAATQYLNPFEIGEMRYRWYASIKTPCNWKVGVEAFNEGYHVIATHPQMLPLYGDDITYNRAHGPHGMFYYVPKPDLTIGMPSPRLNLPMPSDLRPKIIEYFEMIMRDLRAIFTDRDAEASRRLLTEVDPSTPPGEMLAKLFGFQREAAIAEGAGWPDITMQQVMEAGTDWHIFPNFIILPYPDGVLAYRALPHAADPHSCIFEIFALERFAPGAEPKLERQFLHGDDDWRKIKSLSFILQQDFDNMGEVQLGMQSRGFKGARTNPLQEAVVANFHRELKKYVEGDSGGM